MSSADQKPARPDLMGELKFKIPLPIVIPLASLVVIAALAIGFSQILLALPKQAATTIAMATAANVLAGCAFVAYRRRMSSTTWIELVAVILYPVVIAVAIAQIGFGEETAEAHGGPAEPGAAGVTTAVAAEGVAFTLDTLLFEAGSQVSLEFENNDAGTPHNIAIYESEEQATAQEGALFDGEEFSGVAARTYEFKAPKAGEYIFQCDVHPDMKGTVIVE